MLGLRSQFDMLTSDERLNVARLGVYHLPVEPPLVAAVVQNADFG